MLEPFLDTDTDWTFKEVRLRQNPDLPDHVLGAVQWLGFVQYPGYYLYASTDPNDPDQPLDHLPVEFIENHWYFISRIGKDNDTYICKGDRIEPYAHRTGYWRISDPQHPAHVPEELPPVPGSSTSGPSTLTVPRQRAETLESQELSPFRFAENPDLDQEEYFSSVAEATTDVLVAQFHSVLDIRDREPENPLTPDQPAYLHLVEEAVEAGLNIPPPPPLLEEPIEVQPIAAPCYGLFRSIVLSLLI